MSICSGNSLFPASCGREWSSDAAGVDGGRPEILGGEGLGYRKAAEVGAPFTTGRRGTSKGGGGIQTETGDFGKSELAR